VIGYFIDFSSNITYWLMLRWFFGRDNSGVFADEYLLLSAFVISASSDKAIFKAT